MNFVLVKDIGLKNINDINIGDIIWCISGYCKIENIEKQIVNKYNEIKIDRINNKYIYISDNQYILNSKMQLKNKYKIYDGIINSNNNFDIILDYKTIENDFNIYKFILEKNIINISKDKNEKFNIFENGKIINKEPYINCILNINGSYYIVENIEKYKIYLNKNIPIIFINGVAIY